MNIDLNARLAEIDARAEKEKRDATLLASIGMAVPEAIAVERLTVHAAYADARLSLQPVDSVEAANAIMETLTPLPLVRVKRDSLSYQPEERIDANPQKFAGAQLQTIAPFVLKHEQAGYVSIPRTLEWYTRLAGKRVTVELPIKDHRLTVVILPKRRNEHGRYHATSACAEPSAEKDSFWVSDPKESASLVFYWRGTYTTRFGRLDWSKLTR